MRYIHCPSGMKIPYIGFGTYTLTETDIEAVIPLAYRTGYRLFDCAQYYGNESALGRVIKEYNLPRNRLFLSTKVHPDIRTYEEAKQAIEQSLKDLQVDYLDLLLLHSPTPLDKLDEDHTPYYESNHEVYKAMEEAYKEGKAKYLGVSNFGIDDLKDLLSHSQVKISVNQVKLHPHHVNQDLLEYCKGKGILIEAYSPLGSGGLLSDPGLKEIADNHGVNPANICLSFVHQLGCLPITMAKQAEYMAANLAASTELTPDELYSLLQ